MTDLRAALAEAVLALNTGWNNKEPEHLIAERIDICRRLARAALAAQPLAAAPPNDPVFDYAKYLAESLHRKHHARVTQWRPLHDTLGLLTQIDNMVSGLVAADTPTPPATSLDSCGRDVLGVTEGVREPVERIIDEYVADYELRGDEGDHTPSESERILIKDAIMGLLVDPAWDAEWGRHIDALSQPPDATPTSHRHDEPESLSRRLISSGPNAGRVRRESSAGAPLAHDALDAKRLLSAIVWALGVSGDFRTQGTLDGKYWWRRELAERAGLTWNGEEFVAAIAAKGAP